MEAHLHILKIHFCSWMWIFCGSRTCCQNSRQWCKSRNSRNQSSWMWKNIQHWICKGWDCRNVSGIRHMHHIMI
ncbi:hypothetical protein HK096_001229 [Nowakowskiella sp. JEL0078]|nr:hypothetical protein HK096_001229 [Nowakowskiella sp. JEL0078]